MRSKMKAQKILKIYESKLMAFLSFVLKIQKKQIWSEIGNMNKFVVEYYRIKS